MLPTLIDEPQSGDEGVREGAGFAIRALARGIDTVVHAAVGVAAVFAIMILVAIGAAWRGEPTDMAFEKLSATPPVAFVVALVGSIVMHALAEGLHGSTLGKRLCGLTVIGVDGAPATLAGALKRSVAILWDGLFFGLIANQKMSESPRRQRHGDAWAGTQVVRIATLEPAARRSWIRFLLAAGAGLAIDGVLLFIELGLRLA